MHVRRLTAAVMLGAAVLAGCGRHQGQALEWRTTAGDGSRVQVAAEGDRVVVDVWSATGIGHARLERLGGGRARGVLLRFHMQGLERLRIDYGTVVEVSVSSTAPYTWSCSRSSGGAMQAVDDATSPYWMPVRLVAADGGPGSIPLGDGTIEVGLPPDALTARSRVIDLDWIDFYR